MNNVQSVAGLDDADEATLIRAIEQFAATFNVLTATHNQAVNESNESDTVFWMAEQALLAAAKTNLNNNLSVEGAANFWKYIESKRDHMVITNTHPALASLAVQREDKGVIVAAHPILPSMMVPTLGGMTPNYSDYADVAVNFTNNESTSNVQIYSFLSGTTSCSGGVCPIGVFHYATGSLTVSGNVTNSQSNRVLPASYLSNSTTYTMSFDTLFGTFGGEVDIDGNDGVQCTEVGLFFAFDPWEIYTQGGIPIQFEIAFTTVKSNHTIVGTSVYKGVKYNGYSVTPVCSSRTTPPDSYVTVTRATNDVYEPYGWLGMAGCMRPKLGPGTPWVCTTWISGIPGYPLPWLSLSIPYKYAGYDCTKKDAGFKGLPNPLSIIWQNIWF